MNRQLRLFTFVLINLSTASVFAGDLQPPDYRFAPSSTVAGWAFLTEQNPKLIQPDANVPLIVGDAQGELQATFPANAPYSSASVFGDVEYTFAHGGGYQGGSLGDGGIVFIVPNWLETSPDTRMRLRVQVAYLGEEPPITVLGNLGIPGNSMEIFEMALARVPYHHPSLPAGSSFLYEDWLLLLSPTTWTQVVLFIPQETLIQHVVIDTVNDLPGSIFEHSYEPSDFSPWSKK